MSNIIYNGERFVSEGTNSRIKITTKGRIYIAGKISGLDPDIVRVRFGEAAKFLTSEGWTVVNPAAKGIMSNWKKAMLMGIRELFDCNAIYLLTNWMNSTGARIEYSIAVEMNKSIYWEAYYRNNNKNEGPAIKPFPDQITGLLDLEKEATK